MLKYLLHLTVGICCKIGNCPKKLPVIAIYYIFISYIFI